MDTKDMKSYPLELSLLSSKVRDHSDGLNKLEGMQLNDPLPKSQDFSTMIQKREVAASDMTKEPALMSKVENNAVEDNVIKRNHGEILSHLGTKTLDKNK